MRFGPSVLQHSCGHAGLRGREFKPLHATRKTLERAQQDTACQTKKLSACSLPWALCKVVGWSNCMQPQQFGDQLSSVEPLGVGMWLACVNVRASPQR